MTPRIHFAARSISRTVMAAAWDVRDVLGVAAGLLLTLYALAVCTVRGQLLENVAVLGSDAAHADPTWAQNTLATVADDRSLLIAMAVVLLLGWQRRRLRTGAVAAATMLAANVTTQVLKNVVFVRSELVVDPGVGVANSLPSGTVTFLLSAALGLAMVLPRSPLARALAFAALGAAIAGSCATIMLGWHRPADVVAGVVVVVAFFAIASSFLDRTVGTSVSDLGPTIRGLVGCGVVAVIPLLAVLVAPAFALDGLAHGPLVYTTSMVLVAVSSVIAIAPLSSLVETLETAASEPRAEVPDDADEMALANF